MPPQLLVLYGNSVSRGKHNSFLIAIVHNLLVTQLTAVGRRRKIMFDHETINLVISLVFARSFLFHKKEQESIPVGC